MQTVNERNLSVVMLRFFLN